MSMAIEILAAPSLRTSWKKMAAHLEKVSYDRLFLNFPQNLEGIITELSEGKLSYEDFIENIEEERLVPEPVGSWAYTAEPILRSLEELKLRNPLLKIHCYREVDYDRLSAKVASDIAALTLRTSITGKVDVERWKETVKERIERKSAALKDEANFIHEMASHFSACSSGLDGELLKQYLSEKGEKVNLINMEELYHPTPLETLEGRLAREELPDEEVIKLVREHVKYIRDYILMSKNRDQAYYQWAYDKIPSAREKIDLIKIEYMDILLQNNDA